jgi:unsaturated rhamnogalacturonyl hydrolase
MKMPLRLNLIVISILIFAGAHAQSVNTTEETLRKVADHILKDAVFGFEGIDNHQTYTSAKDIPENVAVKYKSPYTGWHYTHGVLNIAMLHLGDYLKDDRYTKYVKDQVAFGFDNYKVFQQRFKHDVKHYMYPYGEFFTMEELDDFGAMGASVMDLYNKVKRPEYKAYVEKAAQHLETERLRLGDGTLARISPVKNTIWGDDLYMSVPFLVRMYKLSGDVVYLNDAIKQVLHFNKYLWDDNKQIYWHCYFADTKQNGVAHWGRCNGWIALAQANLLSFIPAGHPQRAELIRLLQRQIIGLSRYQAAEGLWHQLLDKENSYSESSCSAMFVYTIAKAVNEGWIDKRYTSIATTGWEALKKYKITADGQLKDICVGTEIRNDLVYYYQRPVGVNEKHGLGALIDAGVEILKLEEGQILKKPVAGKLVKLGFDDAAKNHFTQVSTVLE